jgi:TonB family protein
MKTLKLAALFLMMLMFWTDIFSQTMTHAENYGGKPQLKDFIKAEMVYPDKALKDNTEGTVILTFVVTKDGEMINPKVKQPVSPEIDAEALRLLGLLLWDPAEYRGMSLDEENEIEIEFSIKKYHRMTEHRGYSNFILPFEPVDPSTKVYEAARLDKQPKPVYDAKGMNFSSFILKNMTYPKDAIKQNISGAVSVFFVVETSGRISNIKIINGVGAGCNQEAIRLLNLLKWMPGVKNGTAVRTKMTLTITFNLQDFENQKYVPANNANQM